ncbi:ribonuclease H-like domain-containing protein [Tanacetum coccineum]|uniref:Ribonuclease H-like domain-containing protein n=1 Tax=Tanacetum coccineum TaxID=301880 RepID=A0ABQ5EB37_9ASTR
MCALYSRRDTFTPLNKIPKEILAMESISFLPPPTLVGSLEKQTMSKFWDYYRDRGHNTNDCYHLKRQIEEAVASGKLAHLGNYGRAGEKQNYAAEVRNSKVSLTLQRDNGKDGHEKPQDRRFHHLFNDQVSNAKGSGHNANQGWDILFHPHAERTKELCGNSSKDDGMETRRGLNSLQKLETMSQITRDAVTAHIKTASQDLQTASTSEGDLRKFSNIGAWNEVVRDKIPKCMSWLDAYDEPINDLDMMKDKMAEQDIPPPTITAMKIPIIRKGEYDIWSMRMRQYICHTDHNLWDVIVNGDLEEEPAPTGETSAPPAPKTAKQLAAKRNQERVKSILLLAIPDEYLLKFHNVADAKSLWEAIKSRFGGNEESKKMQKNVLKHQFENFTTASNESLDKAYDRFQKLISQLEVHGAPISKEDINQKFLRSLPPSWNQIALIMRNKPDIDEIDIDDLYNNLRVYEDEMKRSSSSTSTSQNLAFLSSENTSSTNEVSTASGDFGVSTAGGISQIDEDDLEELDLRWKVVMLMCYNCHRKGHFARECRSGRNQWRRSYGDNSRSNAPTNESSSQALVAQDGIGGYDWSNDFEVEPVNYALMAISSSSSSSSSDNEVQKCSKQCLESFKTLQKNYDSEREKHSRARLEIQGYELALESLESRILVHEKNELAWGEKYEFQNYELKCREIKINNLNLELEKVVKERDELKLKIEKWEESSKNLDELLNSQISARDKTGLGYDTQLNQMSNNSETNSEISLSVFDVRSSDEENTPANDRFSKAYGFHAVPPTIIGNFLTPRADISFVGLDEYAIRKKIIESKTTDLNTKTSETVNDEDDVSEVQTVNPVKTKENQTVKTRVDKIGLVNLVRPNEKRAVQTINTARSVSTARPFAPKTALTSSAVRPIYPRMDNVRPKSSYSSIKRSYYTKPVFRPKNLKQDVKTFRIKNMTTAGTRVVVNTGKGKMENDLKKSKACWVWRPKLKVLDHDSKNSGSYICKQFDYVDPTGRIKSVMAWVPKRN